MYITKTLEATIDLLDPFEIYSSNLENVVKKKIIEKYVGKCFKSILILEIINIINTSEVIIYDNQLDGTAYIDVQFEVGGIILVEGEILHGCKVSEIFSNAITAEHKYASIKLKKESSNIYKILEPGKMIPIVVSRVLYTPNKNTISMSGTPYFPNTTGEKIFYNITKQLSPEETEKISLIIDMIEKEEIKHKTLSKKTQYSFFQDLLYPFKVNQKFGNNKLSKTMNFKPVKIELKQFFNINGGIVIYPDEEPKENKIFFWSKKINLPKLYTVISSPAYTVLASISNQYLMYLQSLRGFMETYHTPTEMKKIMSYWKFCKNAKF